MIREPVKTKCPGRLVCSSPHELVACWLPGTPQLRTGERLSAPELLPPVAVAKNSPLAVPQMQNPGCLPECWVMTFFTREGRRQNQSFPSWSIDLYNTPIPAGRLLTGQSVGVAISFPSLHR